MFRKLTLRSASGAILILLIGLETSLAQLVNRGAAITLNNNSVVQINGGYQHYEGRVLNKGTLALTGDWVNHSTTVFDVNGGGVVSFAGGDQSIGGTVATQFRKLNLSGRGRKKLHIPSSAAALDLFNAELATGQYVFHVTGAFAESLTRIKGYISSDEGGLRREMGMAGTYLFPVGLPGSQSGYRPVTITSTDKTSFTVSLNENVNSMPGYSDAALGPNYEYIHKKFYYRVKRDDGISPVKMDIFFNGQDDNLPDHILQWNALSASGVALQNFTLQNNDFGDALDGKLSAAGVMDFTQGYFVLARTKALPVSLNVANVFTPNNDGFNDKWIITGIEKYPVNELRIYNRWGAEVFSKKDLKQTDGWSGADEADGTYFYILKVGHTGGKSEVIKGYVTLIR